MLVGVAVIGALLTVVSLIVGHFLGNAVFMFAVGVLATVYLQLFLANYRLLVGVDQIGYQDAFGRPHLWYASQIGRIIDLAVIDAKGRPPRRVVYFLGLDDRRLFLLNPVPWPDGVMARLADAAGKPLEVRSAPISRSDFNKEFPMAVSWAESHGGLLVLGFIILALAIAAALIFAR